MCAYCDHCCQPCWLAASVPAAAAVADAVEADALPAADDQLLSVQYCCCW